MSKENYVPPLPSSELSRNRKDPEPEELEDPSRRKALKKMFGIGAGVTLGSVGAGQPALEFLEETFSSEKAKKELVETQEKIVSHFGVTLDFNALQNEQASSAELSIVEKRDAAQAVWQALQFYPREYIEKTRLEKVQLAKRYFEKGADPLAVINGFVQKGTNPNRVFLSKEPHLYGHDFFGWGSKQVVQGTLHHEMYHLGDEHTHDKGFNQEWLVDSIAQGDPNYQPLKIITRDIFDIRKEGFASNYGSKKPSEDRAEIVRQLMTDSKSLMETAITEPVLLHKILRIKQELFERSAGLMDEGYWNIVAEGSGENVQRYLQAKKVMKK